MNRDDIIRMAREAGGSQDDPSDLLTIPNLERFAALVAAAENEALRAELDRLTTLRPASEWEYARDGYDVLWWYLRNDGTLYGLASRFDHTKGWTPVAQPKGKK